jgi:hypothetical protein
LTRVDARVQPKDALAGCWLSPLQWLVEHQTGRAICERLGVKRERDIRRYIGERAWVFIALVLALTGLGAVTVDDARMHYLAPRESPASHQYMEAMVQNDPAGMWGTYAPQAKTARGGDEADFVASMRQGTHPVQGPPNHFRLLATVPVEDRLTLLYYQVDLNSGAGHVLVPVLIDAAGQVMDAGNDGLFFSQHASLS